MMPSQRLPPWLVHLALLGLAGLFALAHPRAAMADPATAAGAADAYNDRSSASDARLGALLGAGAQWQTGLPGTPPAPGAGASARFAGGARTGCAGIDFNGFLSSFDPAEILAEMRATMLSGAQAAASNYLITLAYSSPTIASVLDMMDKRYSARYAAFSQGCRAQAQRAASTTTGDATVAQAEEQCFAQEIARGSAPTQAYRRCAVARDFSGLDVAAALPLTDFLRKYTNLSVTREFEALLSLLPEERIEAGNYQIRPAQQSVAGMSDHIRNQARAALDRIDAGTDPSSLPACSGDTLLGSIDPGGCLPAAALPLVTSGAFRATRLLGAPARLLFKDALSSQIAVTTMYSNLVDMFQQTAGIDVRDTSGADAAHAQQRRRQLHDAVAGLLLEADTQVKAQNARMQLVRTQMLALERAAADLDAGGRRTQAGSEAPQFGMRDLLRAFADGSN